MMHGHHTVSIRQTRWAEGSPPQPPPDPPSTYIQSLTISPKGSACPTRWPTGWTHRHQRNLSQAHQAQGATQLQRPHPINTRLIRNILINHERLSHLQQFFLCILWGLHLDSQPLLKHPTFFFVLIIALKLQEGIVAWKRKSHSGALSEGPKAAISILHGKSCFVWHQHSRAQWIWAIVF